MANAIDGEGVSEAEANGIMKLVLTRNAEKRDEQIGHLEALQELFDEALACAKQPFGHSQDGDVAAPHRVFRVREIIDTLHFDGIPDYDSLQPLFSGHRAASESGIEQLKKAKIIVATSPSEDAPLLLFGAAEVEQLRKQGKETGGILYIPVESFQQLQLVLATSRKFVGPPDTDGGPWRDNWL